MPRKNGAIEFFNQPEERFIASETNLIKNLPDLLDEMVGRKLAAIQFCARDCGLRGV
ncbi:MAG TPA: hypothetical protein VN857_11835 [Chthoniobacterales bacterium]|nr:hypothetical protein [Chthoniobacterales bacterium]